MADDLPFQVEYAKSGRASCKKCKENIGQDSLRIAIMVQSPFFDGKMATWHHLKCFFEKKITLKKVEEIANFSNLRWEDQEEIKKHLTKAVKNGAGVNSEFSVEYAKSSRSSCRGCTEKILKGVLRISKLDSDNSERKKFGPSPLWHHVDCFVKVRDELEYNDSADKLPGFNALKDEDKQELKEKIGTQGIKRKAEEDSSTSEPKKSVRKENSKLKVQNELIFKMRDNLSSNMKKKDMISLLEFNKQHISTGESRLLDHLSDCLVFGALKECPDCKNAHPRFLNNAYVCPGHLTEWTKCEYQTRYPEREKFVVPDEYKEKFEFLQVYKCKVHERYLPEVAVASTSKKSLPLDNFKIVFIGKVPKQSDIEKQIKELGGSITKTIDSSVKLCISTKAEVEKKTPKITKAYSHDIHVVSSDFVESVRKGSPAAFSIKEHLLSTWGDDPILKFGIKQEHKKRKQEEETNKAIHKSAPQKMKISVKGAAAVDSESGLERSCHVYQKKKDIYNVVLAYVDMSKGTNSFYKMQLLESNKQSKYYLFRQWGRVGTGIGGKKVDNFSGVEAAINEFERLYLEKTLNKWWDRKNFVKKPGGMYPLDIDYGQDDNVHQELKPGDNSKLSKPVQELICLIFDVEAMKKAMVEFEIDLKKMPLGKLSRKQIELAYKVLCEAQQILVTGSNSARITDVTNRFFTLIPHDFGMKKPPLLDHEEIIKSKIEMVDSLMEIEFAYNLIKGEHNKAKDPIDEHYEKLNTDIEALSTSSEDYRRVETYIQNTHAKTHDHYTLELDEVYKINRQGENERYQQFKDLHNKKLLWHGSRITNYVGILSQGLRIAPPEAPPSGYMFGKGIYFADLVSKSANYCCTSRNNSTGILLLCEVALGNMYEKTHSEYIEKLPKGKHSTLGMGYTVPDPNTKDFMGDVEIPYGKPVNSSNKNCALLYNEYIVYDVNQVNIKYLLKVNFKWKR